MAESFGRRKGQEAIAHWPAFASDDPAAGIPHDLPRLPFGRGRSYGDVCLNTAGALLHTRRLDRLLALDETGLTLRCEAGLTLGAALEFLWPRGLTLPVLPGTALATVGGAIANDVHGKNHPAAGSFGCHVRSLELWRSGEGLLRCSPEERPELFFATLGGLGLTGLIARAELRLQPIGAAQFGAERTPFGSLEETDLLFERAEGDHAVAWIDAARPQLPGLFESGRWAQGGSKQASPLAARPAARLRFDLPSAWLAHAPMGALNGLRWAASRVGPRRRILPAQRFLFPLDVVADWNRLYGRSGLLQHQSVLPASLGLEGIRHLLMRAQAGRGRVMLAVLKRLGPKQSGALLSFCRPGYTLALDLPAAHPRSARVLEDLERCVLSAGGALYPAKEAAMTRAAFAASFSRADEFARWVDPAFSSDLWRRVGPLAMDGGRR